MTCAGDLARVALAALLAAPLAASRPAAAEEPHGCDGFRWSLDKERAALVAPGKPVVANGGALPYGAATTLSLAPFAAAGLPRPPSRAPRDGASFAGHYALAAPTKPGIYAVTLAAGGWIEVVDGGVFLHPKAFTDAVGCEGARKSVKFDLPGRPLEVELSGVTSPEIAVIVTAE